MKKILAINILLLIISSLVLSVTVRSGEDKGLTCPERCIESRKNCNQSCSQLVGGGAKSRERRECINECGEGLEQCKVWCVNPTPSPTLKPEKYHDKPCERACELKASDCDTACTVYTGGGAKSEKRAACREECEQGLENCNNWCINPTPRPTLRPNPWEDVPCPEQCRYKKMDCEANCSVYLGGGAKSEKRGKCKSDCEDFNNACLSECPLTK